MNIKLRAWQNSSDLKENHSTAKQHTERDHPLTKKKLSGGSMPSSGMPHSAASKSIFGDASHDGSATETHSFSVPGISGTMLIFLKKCNKFPSKIVRGQPVGNDSHRTVYGLSQDTLSGVPRRQPKIHPMDQMLWS